MKLRSALGLAVCVSLFAYQSAQASSLQDDFTRCIVSHVTPADQDVMVNWTFALIASSPKLSQYVSLTDVQRATINQAWADLHTRLLTKDCRTETILVFKAEGETGIVPGVKAIAGGAMRAMLSTPQGRAGLIEATKLYKNTPQMDALRAEAGLSPNPR